MTSLPDSATFVEVADRALLPETREGQTFIGLGTVEPGEVRRLAPEFEARGTRLLDVPVSGGPHGARDGTLRMFAGGEREVFDACRPVLEVLGDPERIVYCGPSGTGQVVKGVNQMAAGLSNAAFLEAVAFGVLGGADPDAIRRGIGGESGWRGAFSSIAERVVAGEAEYVGVKHGQLPYFLAEAEENGFELPLARALHAFCEGAPEIVREANRMSSSFWRELTERAG
jgi:3-hydroxyisobutyrate dehydrogenase-like beta-hydroxyacid dehydrogenase